jgi:beta-glucosidase
MAGPCLRNAVQRYLVEKARLGIPTFFQGEALHGFMSNGGTSFPQVLGFASTWDPALVQQVFASAADEMGSAGVNQAFTPCWTWRAIGAGAAPKRRDP